MTHIHGLTFSSRHNINPTFFQEHEKIFQIKQYTNLRSLSKVCVLSTEPFQFSQRSTSTALKRKSHYSVETNLNAT